MMSRSNGKVITNMDWAYYKSLIDKSLDVTLDDLARSIQDLD